MVPSSSSSILLVRKKKVFPFGKKREGYFGMDIWQGKPSSSSSDQIPQVQPPLSSSSPQPNNSHHGYAPQFLVLKLISHMSSVRLYPVRPV